VPAAGVTATRAPAASDPTVARPDTPDGSAAAGAASTGAPWRRSWVGLLVPILVCGGALLTLAVGLAAKALGADWGAPAQPLVVFLRPALSTWAIPAALVLGASLYGAVRLLRADIAVRPVPFATATFVLTLLTRLALNVFRGGPGALDQPFVVGRAGEGRTEFLPGLAWVEHGVGHFLDHFPDITAKLPIQAQGHPPGLLLTMHYLGIDSAPGLAALTILVGAAATPLLYLLAREVASEAEARAAALLFVFVPTSLLYGATSADALFATLGVLAAVGLLARRPANRVLGAAALALATFFSYALLAVGAWAALVRWRREGLGAALRLAAICAAVLVVLFVALDLATGFDLVAAIRATDDRYREGIARLRPYVFWLFGSPAAFVLMLGPIAWFAARSLAAKEASAVALATVIAISVVAGYTKAETERIWIFLVPFACLAAARSLPRRWLTPVLVGATAQAVLIEIFLATKW
jgi:methylthioxylose transferase